MYCRWQTAHEQGGHPVNEVGRHQVPQHFLENAIQALSLTISLRVKCSRCSRSHADGFAREPEGTFCQERCQERNAVEGHDCRNRLNEEVRAQVCAVHFAVVKTMCTHLVNLCYRDGIQASNWLSAIRHTTKLARQSKNEHQSLA